MWGHTCPPLEDVRNPVWVLSCTISGTTCSATVTDCRRRATRARDKNWLAESNDAAAAGWQAGVWVLNLQIPNGWHGVSLGRRYRAPRPAVALTVARTNIALILTALASVHMRPRRR